MSGKINYIIGDVTKTKVRPTVLFHCLSTLPAYDAGVAAVIRDKWPEAANAHRKFYKDTACYTDENRVLLPTNTDNPGEAIDFMLGELVLVPVTEGLYIGNIVGQKGLGRNEYGPPVRYEALDEGMYWLAKSCKALKINTVTTVPLGCGLAGGCIREVLPMLWKNFCKNNINVDLYDIKMNSAIQELLNKGLN